MQPFVFWLFALASIAGPTIGTLMMGFFVHSLLGGYTSFITKTLTVICYLIGTISTIALAYVSHEILFVLMLFLSLVMFTMVLPNI